MKRAWIFGAVGLLALAAWWLLPTAESPAQTGQRVQWIWFNEGDPAQDAPAETRYFRRVFNINRPLEQPVDEGTLDITADNAFTVWVNGVQVGKGDDWKRVYRFDVRKLLAHGNNVIAVEAKNSEGPAGLLVRLGYVPNGMSKLAVVSDGSWRSSKTAAEGWQQADFKDADWQPARVLGGYNQAGPWRNLKWDGGGDDRFAVPDGFRVEEAVKIPATDKTFSLVNLTFDNKGRLLVSRENGPILLCTDPDQSGVLQRVREYCLQVKNCQGMCWVRDALLLVGDGPAGTGLYRCRDTDRDDKIDDVKLMHKFRGGMGEHGPHAIIHGPDDWLYLVIGNHAWAQIGPEAAKNGVNPARLAANSPLTRWPTGYFGPDQGKPGTTEDVLLPRLNDGRGHAADILAPGGTIWRFDHEGKNMSLVAAGFRNHFDAAFSPAGELFTFDSDMEWDEGLPWYRAVRVCHCPPGADFVWRTGAANTPDYYIDSLPPVAETGRGSPVGVEFYDHHVFPEKYHGAFFMADWAIGVIFAVHLQRDGASYKTKVERFCEGAPMNVTDIVVGPDGALYFTMGGRGSQGGVFRVRYDVPKANGQNPFRAKYSNPLAKGFAKGLAAGMWLPHGQPFSAYARASNQFFADVKDREGRPASAYILQKRAAGQAATANRIHALTVLQNHGPRPGVELLRKLVVDREAEIRAHAVWLLGVNAYQEGRDSLISALQDADAMVRRRACEALVRSGMEPPLDQLWPLLNDKDRVVRHAARLVLERIEPAKWAERIWKEPNDLIAWNGIIALCHVTKATPYAEQIFTRLRGAVDAKTTDVQPLLDYLRTVQMALIHVGPRPAWVRAIAEQWSKLFPHKDWRVNRELAILLTQFVREGSLDDMTARRVGPRILDELLAQKSDRQQQIHYAYCLRLFPKGTWSPEQATELAAWYDTTSTWRGGHSFTPFLESIFKDTLTSFAANERKQILAKGDDLTLPALVLAQRLQVEDQPELLPDLADLAGRLTTAKLGKGARGEELQRAVADALAQTAVRHPSEKTWPYLVRGLATKNPLLRANVISTLRKLDKVQPPKEDAAPYRAVILATQTSANVQDRWQGIQLLRQWSGRSFGAEQAEWDRELKLWARWFGQSFPKEAPLPFVGVEKLPESKYAMDELLAYLDKEGRNGDVTRGRAVFEKALCIKCHKFGSEGEGVGPDLTALSKRFKRVDLLESLLYPSKVISDQYRSVTITTTKGQSITGLAAVQGDTVTVLLNDATKVTLKRSDIDNQVASLVSIMPERLMDTLTRQEIADLIAYLESEPK